MLVIIDARSPQESIHRLADLGFNVCLFATDQITFDPLSGHPDLFLFQYKEQLIAAPNTPNAIIAELRNNKIEFRFGKKPVGNTMESAVRYNCVVTEEYVIHKKGCTDEEILQLNIQKEFIHVKQSLTRCSLLNIDDQIFITSDVGIHKALNNKGKSCLFASCNHIELPGYPYGLIGGCAGISNKTVYFNGNLNHHKEGDSILNFIYSNGYSVEHLANRKLYDGGGIFFIKESV